MKKIESELPYNFNKTITPKNEKQAENHLVYRKNSKLAIETINSIPKNIEYPIYKIDQENQKDTIVNHVVILGQVSSEILFVLYKNENIKKRMTNLHFCHETRLLLKEAGSTILVPNQELIDQYTNKNISKDGQTTSKQPNLD